MEVGIYTHTQALLRKYRDAGEVTINDYSQYLHDHFGFGTRRNGYFYFTSEDRRSLIDQVKQELGIDIFLDAYPDKQSRENIAKGHKGEKINSYPVSRDFVLINTLNKFHLNGLKFAKMPFTSLGLSIKAHEIISIEHRQIVLVENLTLMANLEALRIPDSLKEALWVYRGDVKPGQQTGMAYEFFRRFNTHKLICFSDLDPAGIQIAMTSGASYWLTPSDCEQAIKLKQQLAGVEQEWMNQTSAKTFLETQEHLPKQCKLAFELMKIQHHTLQQEHMLEPKLPLSLFEL